MIWNQCIGLWSIGNFGCYLCGRVLSHINTCVLLLYSVWLVLQGYVDLTVPLHKLDRSCLQENYYNTLNVNPKVLAGSVLSSKTDPFPVR